jgi:hypothetical protein
MTIYLCATCGTSYPETAEPPAHCPICEDERQYLPASGQGWLSREQLAKGHRNAWELFEPRLYCIQTVPAFGINQRAFLIQTPEGNVLWDCIPHFDRATESLIRSLGGIKHVAISHPHYYSTMQDWAAAFDAIVHLHADDAEWIVRPDHTIKLWHGERLELGPGVTLVRAGGHFAGGTVLNWTGTDDGKGTLMVGDIVQVTPGAHRVSFMWSYPNMMPLPAAAVRSVAQAIAPLRFERIYGAFIGQNILADGPEIIATSAQRYVELLEGPVPT